MDKKIVKGSIFDKKDDDFKKALSYHQKKDFKNAEKFYQQDIKNNKRVMSYNNLGLIYQEKKDLYKAKECFKKAIALQNRSGDVYFNLSLLQLLQFDYRNGFDNYRYRYHETTRKKHTNIFDKKTLLQKDTNIKGKTLLITYEQGFGDNIQFVRFLPEFLKRGAEIICHTKELLTKLFRYNYPDINFASDTKNIKYDYNFPLMESAYLLDITYSTIPYAKKYLSVDKEESLSIKEKFFKNNSKLNIGLIWRSNSSKNETQTKRNDRLKRSIDLELLLRHLPDGYNFYSLQKDTTTKEEKLLKEKGIVSLGNDFVEFYDNALVIDNLDLLVSIDTVSALLAGAMGKKTFVMLPYSPDWRWGADGDKTNWYESITLFRQENDGDWDGVLDRVTWAIEIESI